MNKSALLELASRVEAATGPDQELDDAIFTAVGLCKHRNRYFEESDDPDEALGPQVCRDCGKRGSMAYPLRLYTASLDAAMSPVRHKPQAMAVLRAMLAALGNDAVNIEDLPRIVTAAALRALAKEKGE